MNRHLNYETHDNQNVDFDVDYAIGELVAKVYNNGVEVSNDVQKTAGAPVGILLTPDRTIINADGEDVTIVTVAIVDKDGIIVPDAQNKVDFKIAGNGNLIGTGNGNPMDHDSDKTNFRNAFNGYCIAIVQGTEDSGTINVEASSEGLITAKTDITVSK